MTFIVGVIEMRTNRAAEIRIRAERKTGERLRHSNGA